MNLNFCLLALPEPVTSTAQRALTTEIARIVKTLVHARAAYGVHPSQHRGGHARQDLQLFPTGQLRVLVKLEYDIDVLVGHVPVYVPAL